MRAATSTLWDPTRTASWASATQKLDQLTFPPSLKVFAISQRSVAVMPTLLPLGPMGQPTVGVNRSTEL
jgi:hypothetical protein